jgi:aldehyde:ferredoxin oxidoreductase
MDTMPYADRFLGGRGIATRIYWEEVLPGTGAFDPENRLIFMTGPLVATGTQGAARCMVIGKSPMLMPEGFCYGNIGSFFGPYLKRAGYDGLIIHGRSSKPVYLLIHDKNVQILDASSLWGKGVYAAGNMLKHEYGENLSRSANLMTENDGSVTGGFGAVFGSKNLKAIAVMGSGGPSTAQPDRLKELNKKVYHLCQGPAKPDSARRETGPSAKTAHCYQCAIDCEFRLVARAASGKDIIGMCQAVFVYHEWIVDRNDEPEEAAFDATRLCNDLSICTMEMYNIIAWLDACFASGYLTPEETGLHIEEIGKLSFFEKLAGMIAYRKGFGDILAEGLLRAGEKLGEKARAHFSDEVSDVGEAAEYSGRAYLTNALLYAFEPRQPISMLHEVSLLLGKWVDYLNDPKSSPVTADVFRAVALKFWGHEKAWDMMTHEGKAYAAAKIIDRTIVKDSLGLCDAIWPIMSSWNTPDHVGDPTMESRIFHAATGIEIDEAGLNKYGERIFNLQRAILLREGLQPEKDDFPAEFNFTNPVKEIYLNPDVIVPGRGEEVISRKGQTLDRKTYDRMLKEFYKIRGWDPESGLQRAGILGSQRLSDLAQDLNKIDLLEQ